jgi:hypothetical protein
MTINSYNVIFRENENVKAKGSSKLEELRTLLENKNAKSFESGTYIIAYLKLF